MFHHLHLFLFVNVFPGVTTGGAKVPVLVLEEVPKPPLS